jgi:hypothetical protein
MRGIPSKRLTKEVFGRNRLAFYRVVQEAVIVEQVKDNSTSFPEENGLQVNHNNEISRENYTLVLFSDNRYFTGPEYAEKGYFIGAAEAFYQHSPKFLVGVGDITPLASLQWSIGQYFEKDYLLFPVPGNHDLYDEDLNSMSSLVEQISEKYSEINFHKGPEACPYSNYSFDDGNVHYVVLNIYCDLDNEKRTDGAIVGYIFDWLKEDLENTDQPMILVFGHEPAYPQPDKDLGVVRHLDDSLDKYPITRNRFWKLLVDEQVTAYICGHTHSYSMVNIDGVWQIDIGHTMGSRLVAAWSTFLVLDINSNHIKYEVFRADREGNYSMRYSGSLTD